MRQESNCTRSGKLRPHPTKHYRKKHRRKEKEKQSRESSVYGKIRIYIINVTSLYHETVSYFILLIIISYDYIVLS